MGESKAPQPIAAPSVGHVPLSVVVTTFNNAATLERCLASVAFADERLVVDSYSADETLRIAASHGARIVQREFQGYGPQKAFAISLASHEWVLLLDADEWLPDGTPSALRQWLQVTRADAGRLPRIERMFWRYPHPWSRPNLYLRVFRKHRMEMSDSAIHAAPVCLGVSETLTCPFVHEGEPDIATKVNKLNHYSSGVVDAYAERRFLALRMLLDPPWMFLKTYLIRRQCLSGWAGFIHSVSMAYSAFLRYAKAIERRQMRREWP